MKRRRFVVRKLFLIAVGFVGRGQHDLLDFRASPACFEQGPRFPGYWSRRWRRDCDSRWDDRLRGEMDDGFDLEFAEDAFEQGLITNIAADSGNPGHVIVTDEPALGHPIAHQHHEVGAAFEQRLHHPATDQTRRARHDSAPVAPEASCSGSVIAIPRLERDVLIQSSCSVCRLYTRPMGKARLSR